MINPKKIVAQVRNPISPALRPGFEQELARWNVRLGMVNLSIILAFELYNMLSIVLGGLNTRSRQVYFGMYLLLFAVSLIALAGVLPIRRRVERHARGILTASFLYTFFICAWSAGITLYDQRASENITVYVITVVASAILVYLRPWQAVATYGFNQIALLCLFSTFQPAPTNNTGNFVNTTFMTLIAMFVSLSRYYSRAGDYQNHQIILQQSREIQQMNRQLSRLVQTDTLSGLYNRRFLDDVLPKRFEACVDKALPMAVIMLDIDNFKQYNDQYGHQAGDRCIQTISELLRRCAGEQDDLMRYGGEEFAVVQYGVTRRQALSTAEAIRREMARLRIENKGTRPLPYVTLSEGVCWDVPNVNIPSTRFFYQADQALYEAKRQGKNRVCLYEPANIEAANRR